MERKEEEGSFSFPLELHWNGVHKVKDWNPPKIKKVYI